MRPFRTVPEGILEQLQQFDTCTVSNAIEQFRVRTRNEDFVNGSVRCLFPDLAPKLGYAATAHIGTSSTPIAGHYYYDRMDWWAYVQTILAPRFIVVEDLDHIAGVVSHSYAHIVGYGEPVEVGGLQIKPGNLLHGDQHGVVCNTL
jgi:4-hydroxy-4-methyl-2-oxoglutarate aldolase